MGDWTFVVTGLGMSYICYMVLGAVLSPAISIKRRMEHIDRAYGEHAEIDDERKLPFAERIIEPLKRRLRDEIRKKTPKGFIEQLELKIEKAGRPYNFGISAWLVMKFAISVLLPLFLVTFIFKGESVLSNKFLLSGATIIICIAFPKVMLNSKIKMRRKLVTSQLPDVLDILTVSVESGLSFDSALAKVVEKNYGELAKEFEKVLNEVQLGKTRREALKNMATRCDADDVRLFISSIIQAEQMGVSTGKVLRIQAGQMRIKRKQRAEELALKAPVKMIIPLVFFVFPGLFVVILGPAFIQIKNMLLR
ncbi:tight adherence protein C [Peptoclostridium litorale DSM 5388]|uniref:Putative bacterial type II secretion system protein n=2 Tax=Peptoclostridium litorale TaxID=1557 RepID=A0A069RC00_PEPLI|nr:type II secretion system F family protein [Peptoclostridium litorale]KDR93780.1 putative bacterial type II secretion system protein [Peptoclostridium litorale DSM 5388]SIN85720.1 tight adherence protein C [Peptoclostridium litorale DSM 5388]